MAEDAETIQLFPGAKALLRRLACQGVVLGVVSSNTADNVRRILGPEAAALVEHYECGAALFGKATKFRKVVRRARVKPCETLCIGDETRDIEAAREAGLASGAAAWGYQRREVLAERAPTWFFETPDEVAASFAA
jgi:phosphoglycolate phosphatase